MATKQALKECEECGERFEPGYPDQIFCSDKCSDPERNGSQNQARLQLASIVRMVQAYNEADRDLHARDVNGEPPEGAQEAFDQAERTILEDALHAMVRDGWRSIGEPRSEDGPEEYELLLCTGGPAVRIRGTLSQGEVQSATIQHQDWGTPWTDLDITHAQEETVMAYARVFYWGDS